jgi:hypothetical protein
MAPPVNPYMKKPPLSSGSMIIANPYKKQRSSPASGATSVLTDKPPTRMTHQDISCVPPSLTVPTHEHMDPRLEAAWITPKEHSLSSK